MTIGEQLKKTRNTLQLTQKQMSEGIISESFYSRVECDKSRINIIDLIKILNKHQISLYDFFEPFDEHVFYKENIHCKIVSAFNSHNVKELKNIQTNISNNKLALEIQLMIALLQNKVEELPEKYEGIDQFTLDSIQRVVKSAAYINNLPDSLKLPLL